MLPKNVWRGFMIIAALLLVSACARGASDGEASAVVVPRLASYSEAWQARLLQELEAAGAPCHRQDPAPSCVAWPQGIADDLTLRDQVRAAAGSVDPP